MVRHPYAGLPAHHRWNLSVAGVPSFELDPVVKTTFQINAGDKVATAGSCFAQHIAKALRASGFNYYVTETAPPGMSTEQAIRSNYGTFSARYGNVYTARQMRQLVDRAYGAFSPALNAWQRPDGKFVDPYRPQIQEEGFSTEQDIFASQRHHLACVRQMLEGLDVFVFTLGLTEGWRNLADGAVLPVAPGVSGGTWDPAQYEFVNFRSSEVIEDMLYVIDRLRDLNPEARVILTVSPVPLIATYTEKHVLTATTYSKAVLRVAAEEISAARQNVAYFPSYEIITSNATAHRYYEPDLREVSMLGVKHVMRVFFRHYVAGTHKSTATAPIDVRHELDLVSKVVCDEEILAKAV